MEGPVKPESRSNGVGWTHLGLELVVVVVGILLALGINSWNADRQAAALQDAFLRQLRDDLLRAELQMTGEMAKTAQAEAYTLRVLDAARGDAEVDNDSLASWLIQSIYFSDPRPSTSTVEALAGSENLYVVKSAELRAAVTTMIDRIRHLQIRLVPFEQTIMEESYTLNRWAPPPARGLQETVGMFSSEVDILRSDARSPVTMDLLPVVRRPDVISAMDNVYWAHENHRWYQQEMIRATVELRTAVEAALASR
jgi:hypothetical protein